MSSNKPVPKESAKDAVERLRANQTQESNVTDSSTYTVKNTKITEQNIRTTRRVSSKTSSVRAIDRKSTVNQIIKRLLLSDLTQGQALKELRVDVLGLKQDIYANLVGVSRKTLLDIENDRGNYKTDILNKVFKPFGLKVGMIPSSASALNSLLSQNDASV